MARIIAVLMAVMLACAPAGAQQPTVVCTPTGGQVICQPQPTATAKRLAIVAAAIAGVPVVCYAVHKHYKKHAEAPARAQPRRPVRRVSQIEGKHT